MDKKLKGWMNLALGSAIVALGFGSCRTVKIATDDDNPQPRTPEPRVIKKDKIDPPVCIYGPPEMLQRRAIKAVPEDSKGTNEDNKE